MPIRCWAPILRSTRICILRNAICTGEEKAVTETQMPQADQKHELNGAERLYSVRAAERVCDILDLLREHPSGMSLMDITSNIGLPKSSVFRYLWTLETRQYVERVSESAAYVLGSAFLPMHIRRSEILSHIARPRLETLRNTFEETANLGIFDGTRVVYLEIVESTKSMRLSARVGNRDPIHSTALARQSPPSCRRTGLARFSRVRECRRSRSGRSPIPMHTWRNWSRFAAGAMRWMTGRTRSAGGASPW